MTPDHRPRLIYKIVAAADWQAAEAAGEFAGAAIDLQDGFIHFSAADQVQETADRHFAGVSGLLLVAVDADTLGTNLKWEVSRGGDRFPHLYAPLDLERVVAVAPIEQDPEGRHRLQHL